MINNTPRNRQDSHNNNKRLEGRKNQMRGISRFAKTPHTQRQIQRCTAENKRPHDHYACHRRLQPDMAACRKQKQGDRSAFFSTGTNDERCSVVAQTCFTGPFCNTTSHPKEMTIVYYHCIGLWLKQLPPKTSPPWTLAPLLQCPPKGNVGLKTGLLEMMWMFSPHRTEQGWGRLKNKMVKTHTNNSVHTWREKNHALTLICTEHRTVSLESQKQSVWSTYKTSHAWHSPVAGIPTGGVQWTPKQ